MFGMGFFEILVIAVVAIIFLGPEKLPKALVDVAKFLKALKRTIQDAKDSLDKEVNLSKIKEEALAYRDKITQETQSLTKELELKEITSFDFGDTLSIKESQNDIKDNAKEKKLFNQDEGVEVHFAKEYEVSECKEGIPREKKEILNFKKPV